MNMQSQLNGGAKNTGRDLPYRRGVTFTVGERCPIEAVRDRDGANIVEPYKDFEVDFRADTVKEREP